MLQLDSHRHHILANTQLLFESVHYKMACMPSEDSDQPEHLPSLIGFFALHSMGS